MFAQMIMLESWDFSRQMIFIHVMRFYLLKCLHAKDIKIKWCHLHIIQCIKELKYSEHKTRLTYSFVNLIWQHLNWIFLCSIYLSVCDSLPPHRRQNTNGSKNDCRIIFHNFFTRFHESLDSAYNELN